MANTNERKVIDLVSGKGEVYILCRNDEVCKKFLHNAGAEGFRFGDGRPANKGDVADIYCITEDKQIMHVGYTGHMAFAIGRKGGKSIDRIDYEKYLDGAEDFLYHE